MLIKAHESLTHSYNAPEQGALFFLGGEYCGMDEPPNELRIDAAEEEKIKITFLCAAASIRVELSRAQEDPEPLFGN